MARESLIKCRVSEEAKSSLQTLASQKGLTESAVVRRLIETSLEWLLRGLRLPRHSKARRQLVHTSPSGVPRHKMLGKRSPFGVKRRAMELMQ